MLSKHEMNKVLGEAGVCDLMVVDSINQEYEEDFEEKQMVCC